MQKDLKDFWGLNQSLYWTERLFGGSQHTGGLKKEGWGTQWNAYTRCMKMPSEASLDRRCFPRWTCILSRVGDNMLQLNVLMQMLLTSVPILYLNALLASSSWPRRQFKFLHAYGIISAFSCSLRPLSAPSACGHKNRWLSRSPASLPRLQMIVNWAAVDATQNVLSCG